jgi:hypothetical protein
MGGLITGHLLMIGTIKMTVRPIYVLTKMSFSQNTTIYPIM